MTREKLEEIRKRKDAHPSWGTIGTAHQDRRALLAYVDRLRAVVAAADAWLAGFEAHWTDTTEEAEAYRAARKTLEEK